MPCQHCSSTTHIYYRKWKEHINSQGPAEDTRHKGQVDNMENNTKGLQWNEKSVTGVTKHWGQTRRAFLGVICLFVTVDFWWTSGGSGGLLVDSMRKGVTHPNDGWDLQKGLKSGQRPSYLCRSYIKRLKMWRMSIQTGRDIYMKPTKNWVYLTREEPLNEMLYHWKKILCAKGGQMLLSNITNRDRACYNLILLRFSQLS